jgi:hypothetical protein
MKEGLKMKTNKILIDKEVKKILEEVKATLAMEDLCLTDKESKILQDFTKGIYTRDQVIKLLDDQK